MIAAEQYDLFAEQPELREHAGRMLAYAQRERAVAQVEQNAGEDFMARALEFVPKYLATHGPTSGEQITNACKDDGICPHSDKAFGAVLLKLSRMGVIAKAGYCQRLKGHGTAGGITWRLV